MHKLLPRLPILLSILPLLAGQGHLANAQDRRVDFRFSPPFWQSTVCLPDDPWKTLVDEHGNLMIHSSQKVAYGDPQTLVGIGYGENGTIDQHMLSARLPVVITEHRLNGLDIREETFTVTAIPGKIASAAIPLPPDTLVNRGAGQEKPHNDVILATISNTGESARTLKPFIRIKSSLPVSLSGGKILLGNRESLSATLPLDAKGIHQTGKLTTIPFVPLRVGPGQSVKLAVVLVGGGSSAPWPTTTREAVTAEKEAETFWSHTQLPYGRITVPDPGIQNLIDASIRNIWQSREIKNNLPAFQVGPTCYRGLWIVDGAFLLEAATILGTGSEARNGVMYNLSFQKDDGRFEVMNKYWKENGIITWTAIRHAMLTQDKQWLESVWPKLERAMVFVTRLREESRRDTTPLNDGLMPAGTIDGGLDFGVEYTNVYWNLLGMKSFIQAARWLGKDDEAVKWQKEYDDFYTTFRKAAKRDLLHDPYGDGYLPTLMGKAGAGPLPQKAQWSFCQAVYPGQLFDRDDSLVGGNLAMLERTEREGMVYGTGWDSKGLWNYFASFYGHAWLWQGNGTKAADILYAFANHASPLFAWREEQSPKGEPYKKVGDMPHNWASAEFIRLTVHLLALDRGTELHLFEGLPPEWTRSGMVTRLNGISTPFGPLDMELKVARDGKTADLHVEPLPDPSCTGIFVHTSGWAGNNGPIRLDPTHKNHLTLNLKK